MIKLGFGRSIKPRTFEYVPRFYDPVKEERKERQSKFNGDISAADNIDQMKSRIQRGMRSKYYGDPLVRRAGEKKANIRIFITILFLFFVAYLLFKSDKIASLLEVFNR